MVLSFGVKFKLRPNGGQSGLKTMFLIFDILLEFLLIPGILIYFSYRV